MSGGNFGLLDFISMKNSENCLYKYRNWNIITIHHERQLFLAEKQFLLMDSQHVKCSVSVSMLKLASENCLTAQQGRYLVQFLPLTYNR